MLWEKPGKSNTYNTLEVALDRAQEMGINQLVVASNEGDTVLKLIDLMGKEQIEKYNIVCVTHQVGFKEPGYDEMSPEIRNKLKDKGVKIYTGTHLLG